MPPKKKDLKANNGIVNFYEVMDKSFLVEAENPNFHLHNFKLPFRCIVNAPSGSGKTNFVVSFLALCAMGKGTFANILILTRCADEPLYNYLKSKSDRIIIKEGLHHLPKLEDYDKETNSLIIIDDLVTEKKQENVEKQIIRMRKFNVSLMYLSQSYYRIPKIIRQNSNYLVILRIGSERDLKLILYEGSMGIERETLVAMYNYATAEKFMPLIIDYDSADLTHKFRKGFLEYLNPSDFVHSQLT